ncbi:MAG: uncharacterized protein PWP23_1004 [Candidatus Sumerlaeota bacterium]|nr:uncharacterized protein [Candidatus Sumerlaeota bacterium]
MTLQDRLDALRTRKRQQQALLDAVRAGQISGVACGESAIAPRPAPVVDRLELLRRDFPQARSVEAQGGRALLIETRIPVDATPQQYELPVAFLPLLDEPQRLFGFYPDIAPLGEAYDPTRIVFLDTETTGLAGGTGTLAFLIGAGWFERDAAGRLATFVLEQYLIDDFCHESAQLALLAERLAGFDACCTYNGKAFDVPLLRTRFVMNRLRPTPLSLPNLDLLPFSRRLWRGALPSVSLGTVEREIFGIIREQDIESSLIPSIWLNFAATGNPTRLASVLHHNAQDIVTLGALLALHARCADAAADPAILRRASECHGLARWHEARKEWSTAARLVERALQIGSHSPSEEDRLLLALARIHKRGGEYERAVETWRSLQSRPMNVRLPALVELAKHFEHRTRDIAAARLLIHDCLRQIELEAELRAVTGRASSGLPTERDLQALRRRLERLDKKAEKLRAATRRPAC